ncbi:MAG: CBS domain-containing protein, partial [Actinomycetota bacterium]
MVGGVRRRIGSGDADPQAPDARLRPVGSLVRRAPVTADATTPVAEAAARMASERVSCLLVPMRGAWGIVTDRDLRTRVVATGAVPATPLEAIATFPVRTIASDTLAGEALLAMFAQGVHHF